MRNGIASIPRIPTIHAVCGSPPWEATASLQPFQPNASRAAPASRSRAASAGAAIGRSRALTRPPPCAAACSP
jgi:hypothetical protein